MPVVTSAVVFSKPSSCGSPARWRAGLPRATNARTPKASGTMQTINRIHEMNWCQDPVM
jgi:hypothetical protein